MSNFQRKPGVRAELEVRVLDNNNLYGIGNLGRLSRPIATSGGGSGSSTFEGLEDVILNNVQDGDLIVCDGNEFTNSSTLNETVADLADTIANVQDEVQELDQYIGTNVIGETGTVVFIHDQDDFDANYNNEDTPKVLMLAPGEYLLPADNILQPLVALWGMEHYFDTNVKRRGDDPITLVADQGSSYYFRNITVDFGGNGDELSFSNYASAQFYDCDISCKLKLNSANVIVRGGSIRRVECENLSEFRFFDADWNVVDLSTFTDSFIYFDNLRIVGATVEPCLTFSGSVSYGQLNNIQVANYAGPMIEIQEGILKLDQFFLYEPTGSPVEEQQLKVTGGTVYLGINNVYNNFVNFTGGDITSMPNGRPFCNTSNRPQAPFEGQMIFDIDLGIPIWYANPTWVNCSGVVV